MRSWLAGCRRIRIVWGRGRFRRQSIIVCCLMLESLTCSRLLMELTRGCWIVSVQLGNIIANNIYRADDKPQYRRGNAVLFAINLLAIALFLLTKAYYILRNRQRSRVWDGMTPEVSDEPTTGAAVFHRFQNNWLSILADMDFSNNANICRIPRKPGASA